MSDEIFTLYYKPDGSKDKFGEIIYLIHINEHEMAVTTNPPRRLRYMNLRECPMLRSLPSASV